MEKDPKTPPDRSNGSEMRNMDGAKGTIQMSAANHRGGGLCTTSIGEFLLTVELGDRITCITGERVLSHACLRMPTQAIVE